MLNKVALEAEYDRIYAAADEAFKRHNPCQIQRDASGVVSCADTRLRAGDKDGSPVEKQQMLCCGGCKHLGPEGCTVKSLSCKLWVCRTIFESKSPVLVELNALKKRGWAAGVPWEGYRVTREQFLERIR